MVQKGISLPINMVVILAVAVLVLVVVAAFFVFQTAGSQVTIRDQDAWGTGCSMALSRGCPLTAFQDAGSDTGLFIPRYDPNGDDPKSSSGASQCSQERLTTDGCDDDILLTACKRTQGVFTAEACRNKCCGA